MSRSEQPRIAVVLSGGGARGAYEAGVLYYVLERLPHVLGRPVHLDILSGSSVGAIHACFVAGHAGDPGALERLLAIWRAFDVDSVYDVRARAVVGFALGLLGFRSRAHPVAGDVPQAPTRIPGLLDASPLERLILNEIPWQRIPEKLAGGALDTLAIAATEVKSGRTIVFVENREGRVDRWAHDPFIVARPERIGPEHALASAAIPLFFPTIRIGGSYYCDGSLRLNTPLAPALRLGADRVLVIGVHHVRARGEPPPDVPEETAGTPAFLAGKVLNALLLDRIDYDADRLRLVNAMLEQGQRVYGPRFLDDINEVIVKTRGTSYRIVRDLFIRPSQDLGAIAADCIARHRPARPPRSILSRAFLRFASRNTGHEADLLSYFYFDGCYARHLIDLGIADAEAQTEELVAFFS